jgi:GNAT superfamily N-acetyltransferase
MIAIRQATPNDAPSLARLRWEFRASIATPIESEAAFLVRCAEWMRQALLGGSWRAWLAQDDAIVGQLWMRIIQKIPNPIGERDRHAYISNLYVTPSARGGVGEKLLDAAVDWARANRVDEILLWPTERSRPLYVRHGFSAPDAFLSLKCE